MRSERADGGGRDSEDLRGFFALQVEEIQKHECRALALRQLSERANDVVAEVGGRERVLGRMGGEGPSRGELQPPGTCCASS